MYGNRRKVGYLPVTGRDSSCPNFVLLFFCAYVFESSCFSWFPRVLLKHKQKSIDFSNFLFRHRALEFSSFLQMHIYASLCMFVCNSRSLINSKNKCAFRFSRSFYHLFVAISAPVAPAAAPMRAYLHYLTSGIDRLHETCSLYRCPVTKRWFRDESDCLSGTLHRATVSAWSKTNLCIPNGVSTRANTCKMSVQVR